MEDTDPMPFGKHKGQPMQDVPTSYLHWLLTKGGLDRSSPVGRYIKRSLSALQQEQPDLIWD